MKTTIALLLALAVMPLTACVVPDHALQEAITPRPAEKKSGSKTIVFIHGMFMTPLSWESWQRYFEAQGFKTYAPAWPQHQETPAVLRQHLPNAALNALTLADVLAEYRKIIDALPEKPILVGHSMGGLIAQLLLAEGRGTAGVAIDSAPPQGMISLHWSFLRSNWPVISPFEDEKEAVLLDRSQFAYAFTNCLPEAEEPAIYAKYAVPESRLVGKASLTDVTKIDFSKKAAPLLFVAGGEDHIIPASLNFKNFEAYAEAPSRTEFKLFPGRCHWTVGQKNWQDVASYVLTWIKVNP